MDINPNIDTSRSQSKSIRMALENGEYLTTLEAMSRFGAMYPAKRISELRADGLDIKDKWIVTPYSNKRIKEYFLETIKAK